MTNHYQAFNSVASVTPTNPIELGSQSALRGRDERSVQVTIVGTSASVDIEARLDATQGWAKVETGITANKIVRIGSAQAVRLNVTAINSATVSGGVLV